MRTAIGASRFVILRQVLTESVMLAAVGGVAGLLLAVWGTDLLLGSRPARCRACTTSRSIGACVTFTALITIGTGLLFGFMPAIQLSSSDSNGTLKEGGRSVTGAGGGNRTRSALVIAEVALSLILLAGAGLLSATLLRLQHVDPGFDSIQRARRRKRRCRTSKYKTDAQQTAFYDLMLDKVRTIPGVIRCCRREHSPLERERHDDQPLARRRAARRGNPRGPRGNARRGDAGLLLGDEDSAQGRAPLYRAGRFDVRRS